MLSHSELSIKDVISELEKFAPSIYQENYDNSGLIVGDVSRKITGILVTLDITEALIAEAISQNCNLVVAHHPILFKPIKNLTGKNYVERVLLKAIENKVALYAIHTNLDNMAKGVNYKIAQKLGLENLKILSPTHKNLYKLTTFCPNEYKNFILEAMWAAGAGSIGNYDDCSFQVQGIGTYRPTDQATPFQGQKGILEDAPEVRLEVLVPTHAKNAVLQALRKAHPYEEIAYYLHLLENENQDIGAGMIGYLPEAMPEKEFLTYLKSKMNLSLIRHTAFLGKKVQKVALCGGSGFFLLGKAIAQEAESFITSDVKYHEFFDAENRIVLADIGHYESEFFTKELLFEILSEKFTNIAVQISKISTNPVYYF
ncbi:MAG: Nif3-like dinuclear metal center hexameric protein [Raineya sp.]